MNKEPYSSLYKILGFYPDNIHLYEQAFLHKSSSVESGDGRWLNNERLEFLGDAVLDAVVADIVYKHFQNKREGFLTNTRSKIVQRETMNRVAVELGLDKMVVYSAKLSSHNNHMYGNALEALIGAIWTRATKSAIISSRTCSSKNMSLWKPSPVKKSISNRV